MLIIPVIDKLQIRIGILVITIILMIVNCYGSILPQTNHEHDYSYKFNSWLINNCRKGDLVVSGSGYISDSYVRFYAKGIDIFSPFIDQNLTDLGYYFKKTVTTLKPKRILFSSTIYYPNKRYMQTEKIDTNVINQLKAFFLENNKNLLLIHSDQWQDIFLFEQEGILKE